MKRDRLIHTALGKEAADLVFTNGRIVNVFTGEILEGDIAVTDGFIVGVGKNNWQAKQTIDLAGNYVAPGFIDAHCHIESSMVTPPAYCAEAVKWGTTTLITDPHEIANVAGAKGIQYMLDSSASLPMNYFVQMPSCVPATPFEHAGADMKASDIQPFYRQPRVLGLGEMMNYPGIAACDHDVMEKLAVSEGRIIDGHAPALTGRDLQAYICAGIETDHESTTFEEAREKLRAGMAVLVREGSACKNLQTILSGVLEERLDTHHLAFCTDDKHLVDIRREGTIRHCVREAVKLGMPAITAIQMATINAAKIYRLEQIGAIAPGYRADLVILNDLEQFEVRAVYKDGARVLDTLHEKVASALGIIGYEEITRTVRPATLGDQSLLLPKREMQPVINVQRGQVVTKRTEIPGDQVTGLIATGRLRKIAVIERHHATGHIGVGVIAGYGLNHGAVATTVAHDSHNIIVVGDNDKDMLIAVKELIRIQGGYTLVCAGSVLGALPLPVGGLMSRLSADELIPALEHMIDLAKEAGVSQGIDPFTTLSFMALPVIPEERITDMGLFNVTKFEFE